MIEPPVKDALSGELARLDEADRKRVLEYARTLSERTPHALALLFSPLPDQYESDKAEIEAAIEERCEKVNPGAW